jgi:hypothetical protein
MNFDHERVPVPIVRDWHMRFSDMPITRKTHVAMLDFPIPGTLGGWHIGMLAPSPSKTDGLNSLRELLKETNQMRRFREGAGVPTLLELYRNDRSVREEDPITRWSLGEIRQYLGPLIRRSEIPSYPAVRKHLIDLGYKILRAPLRDAKKVATAWRG